MYGLKFYKLVYFKDEIDDTECKDECVLKLVNKQNHKEFNLCKRIFWRFWWRQKSDLDDWFEPIGILK